MCTNNLASFTRIRCKRDGEREGRERQKERWREIEGDRSRELKKKID